MTGQKADNRIAPDGWLRIWRKANHRKHPIGYWGYPLLLLILLLGPWMYGLAQHDEDKKEPVDCTASSAPVCPSPASDPAPKPSPIVIKHPRPKAASKAVPAETCPQPWPRCGCGIAVLLPCPAASAPSQPASGSTGQTSGSQQSSWFSSGFSLIGSAMAAEPVDPATPAAKKLPNQNSLAASASAPGKSASQPPAKDDKTKKGTKADTNKNSEPPSWLSNWVTLVQKQLGLLWPVYVALLVLSLFCSFLFFLRSIVYRHYYYLGLTQEIHATESYGTSSKDDSQPPLLPSQKELVKELVSELAEFNPNQDGPMYALEGRWGEGKSFLTRKIQSCLFRDHPNCATIYVHVWREETEEDLHRAVVNHIMSHPKILEHAFDYYPTARVITRKLGRFLGKVLRSGTKIPQTDMEVDLTKMPIRLMAQRDLERIVAGMRRNGKRVVLILDEIDRATPQVAQAALVLCKRSFNLPGMAVLMPFVRTQLEEKICNPLIIEQPDLKATFMALLAEHYNYQLTERSIEPAEKTVIEKGPNLLAIQRSEREQALLNAFWSDKPVKQRRITEISLEKYFEHIYKIKELGAKDIQALTTNDIHEITEKLIKVLTTENNQEPSDQYKKPPIDIDRWTKLLKNGLAEINEKFPEMPPPTARHFMSRWNMFFREAKIDEIIQKHKNIQLLEHLTAAVAGLAWRSAQYLQVTNKSTNIIHK